MESSWVELLLTTPVPERVRLTSFLLRVQPFFPRWQGTWCSLSSHSIDDRYAVLSWSAITDVLLECNEDINKPGNEVIPGAISLQVSRTLHAVRCVDCPIPSKGSIIAYRFAHDHKRCKRQRPDIAEDQKVSSGGHRF